MRKNKFFIAGLVTVFVALVSLTLVSSTWAKYTSTQSGSDSARVAYWGIGEVHDVEYSLFADAYAKADPNYAGPNSVDADEKVIAPGTEGSYEVKLQYKTAEMPEVAYSVIYDLSESGVDATLAAYDNIQWRVYLKSEAPADENTGWASWNNTAKTLTAKFNPGQKADDLVIEWRWLFGDGTTDTTDTTLGNESTARELTIKVKLTATQID